MNRKISSQPETSRIASAAKHIHDIRAFCKNPTFSGWKKLSNKIKFPFVEGSEYCIKNSKGNQDLARKIVIFSEGKDEGKEEERPNWIEFKNIFGQNQGLVQSLYSLLPGEDAISLSLTNKRMKERLKIRDEFLKLYRSLPSYPGDSDGEDVIKIMNRRKLNRIYYPEYISREETLEAIKFPTANPETAPLDINWRMYYNKARIFSKRVNIDLVSKDEYNDLGLKAINIDKFWSRDSSGRLSRINATLYKVNAKLKGDLFQLGDDYDLLFKRRGLQWGPLMSDKGFGYYDLDNNQWYEEPFEYLGNRGGDDGYFDAEPNMNIILIGTEGYHYPAVTYKSRELLPFLYLYNGYSSFDVKIVKRACHLAELSWKRRRRKLKKKTQEFLDEGKRFG
jgi:hypothetical protein